jgi:hypothetical protein
LVRANQFAVRHLWEELCDYEMNINEMLKMTINIYLFFLLQHNLLGLLTFAGFFFFCSREGSSARYNSKEAM